MASEHNRPEQPQQQPQGQNEPRRTSNRGTNLSQDDRSRGGQHSAQSQGRDAQGQFAGKKTGTNDRPGTSANWRDESKPGVPSQHAGKNNVSGPKLPDDDDEDTDDIDTDESEDQDAAAGRKKASASDEDDVADDADVDETEDHSSVNTSRTGGQHKKR